MESSSPEPWIEAAEAASLTPGKAITALLAGKRIAVLRTEAGWFALDDLCPHRGGPLGAGWLEGGKVHCPLHGWAFDLKTGACVERPERPVRAYTVELREGRVFVRVPPAVTPPAAADASGGP